MGSGALRIASRCGRMRATQIGIPAGVVAFARRHRARDERRTKFSVALDCGVIRADADEWSISVDISWEAPVVSRRRSSLSEVKYRQTSGPGQSRSSRDHVFEHSLLDRKHDLRAVPADLSAPPPAPSPTTVVVNPTRTRRWVERDCPSVAANRPSPAPAFRDARQQCLLVPARFRVPATGRRPPGGPRVVSCRGARVDSDPPARRA